MTYKHQIVSNPLAQIAGGQAGDLGSQLSGLIGQAGGLINGGVGLPGINSLGSLISSVASSISSSNSGTNISSFANTIAGLGSQMASGTMAGMSSLLSSMQSSLSSLLGAMNPGGLLANVLHVIQLDAGKGILSSAFQGQHTTTWDQNGVTHTSSTAVTSTAPMLPHNGKTLVSDTLNVTRGIFGQSFSMLSDEALKSNIEDHEPVLERVMRLKLKTFDIKDVDWETGEALPHEPRRSLGYIAQHVQEIFPQLVKREGKFLSLESDKFAPIMIAAFQEYVAESRAEIAALKQEIAELKP
jgi:hypothetical protein